MAIHRGQNRFRHRDSIQGRRRIKRKGRGEGEQEDICQWEEQDGLGQGSTEVRAHCNPDHGRSEDVVSEEDSKREELHSDAALREAKLARRSSPEDRANRCTWIVTMTYSA